MLLYNILSADFVFCRLGDAGTGVRYRRKKYSSSVPSHLPLMAAIRLTFTNRNFKYYLISDFSYYMALSIISSGLLFFVKVLLRLPESIGRCADGGDGTVSLTFYPLINYLSKRIGKNRWCFFIWLIEPHFCSDIFPGGISAITNGAGLYTGIKHLVPAGIIGYIAQRYTGRNAQNDAEKTAKIARGCFLL